MAMTRLWDAMKELLAAIDAGGEYPDLEWKVSRKHRVSPSKIREAYDDKEYCAQVRGEEA